MKSNACWMALAAGLASFAVAGCAMGTDSTDDPSADTADSEATQSAASDIVTGYPYGYGGMYNPPGYNPPGYNPYNPTVNPPGYNPPGYGGYGYGYPGRYNPPGYNPPGYNPYNPVANPPGYNPPGMY